MKKSILFLLFFFFFSSSLMSQQADAGDEKAIHEKVNLFFKALETRDTALYKTLVFADAQIWTVRWKQDTLKNATRTFQRDMINLAASKAVIEERPFLVQVTMHNDIAIAWVPYQLSVDGQFSHCGIDVFTFLRTREGWKIVNTAYSIEPDGCKALKKKYNIQ